MSFCPLLRRPSFGRALVTWGLMCLVVLLAPRAFAEDPSAPTPADFPQPVVVPYEDLNVFEMSTLGGGGLSPRQTTSTLQRRMEKKSNVEVNTEIKKRLEERRQKLTERAEKKAEAETQGLGEAPTQTASVPSLSPRTPRKSGTYYVWTDENGVVHVSNTLIGVPLKEQMKILGYEEEGGEQQSAP